MNAQKVVAAIIEKNGLILVAKRGSGSLSGKWEFPGGKVRKSETPQAALRREIHEEFGVEIDVGVFVCEEPFSVDGRQYVLAAYLAEHVEGELIPAEHEEIRWLLPSEICGMDLTPADVQVAKRIAALYE